MRNTKAPSSVEYEAENFRFERKNGFLFDKMSLLTTKIHKSSEKRKI